MLCFGDIKAALLEVTRECDTLWEENKDMQGRLVNDLAELHRMQVALNHLEQHHG